MSAELFDLQVGRRVRIDGRAGVIRFLGYPQFGVRKEEWVGIELEEPEVRHAASVLLESLAVLTCVAVPCAGTQ